MLDVARAASPWWPWAASPRWLACVALERDYARAEMLSAEALAWSQAHQATLHVAEALKDLGRVFLRQGLFARVAAQFEQSLRRFRDVGAKRGAAMVLQLQAQLAIRAGALDRTEVLLEESLALYREEGMT